MFAEALVLHDVRFPADVPGRVVQRPGSTLLTLLIVPSGYRIIEDAKALVGRLRRGKPQARPAGAVP